MEDIKFTFKFPNIYFFSSFLYNSTVISWLVLSLVSLEQPLCLLQFWPLSKGLSYIPGIFKPYDTLNQLKESGNFLQQCRSIWWIAGTAPYWCSWRSALVSHESSACHSCGAWKWLWKLGSSCLLFQLHSADWIVLVGTTDQTELGVDRLMA
jgi:hypothetical protein